MSCTRSTPQYPSRRVDDEPRLLREMRALARRRPRFGADHFYDYVCTGRPQADSVSSPEPSTMVLLGIGGVLLAFVLYWRRRR